MSRSIRRPAWTVAEAKTHLSEILRLAEQEGPQRIGTRKSFIVVPAELWRVNAKPRTSLGRWLVSTVPRGVNLNVPNRRESAREIPFADGEIG